MRPLIGTFVKKLMTVIGIILASFFGFSSCRSDSAAMPVSTPSPDSSNKEITAQDLIDAPSQFDGKEVVTTGLASIKFENTALRPIKPSKNTEELGVWLEFANLKSEYKKFDGKHVRVRGTFSAGKQGHFGMFKGVISNIKEVATLEK
jgi:hypothetical protein